MVDSQEDTWVSARLWTRSDKGITCARQETMLGSGASSATPAQPVAACKPVAWALCISTTSGPPPPQFERVVINVAGSFPQGGQGNQYLVIAMDYLYQVAGGLHHPQPGGFNCGRSPHDQLFLPLWSTARATQCPVWCRWFCNACGWSRYAPHPCTHSQTALGGRGMLVRTNDFGSVVQSSTYVFTIFKDIMLFHFILACGILFHTK
jgi:hypothetical protein